MKPEDAKSVAARPIGFNVIGNVTANNGLGVAARSVIELLVARRMPVSIFNIPAGLGRDQPERRHESLFVESLASLPYVINLFVLPLSAVSLVLPQVRSAMQFDSYFNAGLCFWELPTVPSQWIPALESFDALVATSSFMAHVYRCSVSGTAVVDSLLPIDVPAIKRDGRFRDEHGIGDDAVVFMTTFDPLSDPVRKNPEAAIDAFLQGVGDDEQAYFLLRVNNASALREESAIVKRLRLKVAAHPRIVIHVAPLAHEDVIHLYSQIDVFVSLHRAEGLGLAMAEAMALSKPVIATAWSGNLTFMDRSTACLVGYRLIPVEGAMAYPKEQLAEHPLWADAIVSEAANWMAKLCGDANLRACIGIAGRNRLARHNDEARHGAFLEELQLLLSQTDLSHRRSQPAREPNAEVPLRQVLSQWMERVAEPFRH